MKKAKAENVKIHLPVDFVCAQGLGDTDKIKTFNIETGIPDGKLFK